MTAALAEIALIVLLVMANGIFSTAEIALLSARKVRLKQQADRGSRGSRAALTLAEDPDIFLPTVQVGITLVGILAGAVGGATLADEIAARLAFLPGVEPYAEAIALGLVVLGITYLTLVVGELVPKRLALAHPEAIASRLAGPLRALAFLARPVVAVLRVSTDGILRLLGIRPTAGPAVTEDEIRGLIREGARTGVITETEHAMVSRVLRLDDRPVGAVMTRRRDVVWLDATDAPEEIRRKIESSPHSRFPVCDGTLDKVLGVVHVKDLLLRGLAGRPYVLSGLVRVPLFFYEGLPALEALERFRSTGVHVAIVLDEYGSFEGLLTPTDLMEAIVGEIGEADDDSPPAVRRDDGSWLVDGAMPLDEFAEALELPDIPAGDFHTVAGFVLAELGRIPAAGDAFDWGRLRVEVVDMDGRRVDKVLVSVREA